MRLFGKVSAWLNKTAKNSIPAHDSTAFTAQAAGFTGAGAAFTRAALTFTPPVTAFTRMATPFTRYCNGNRGWSMACSFTNGCRMSFHRSCPPPAIRAFAGDTEDTQQILLSSSVFLKRSGIASEIRQGRRFAVTSVMKVWVPSSLLRILQHRNADPPRRRCCIRRIDYRHIRQRSHHRDLIAICSIRVSDIARSPTRLSTAGNPSTPPRIRLCGRSFLRR